MAKSKLSGAREAPLYPKSSGVSATNENQMVASAAFQWSYSSDKRIIYVTPKEGYVVLGIAPFSFTTSEDQNDVFQAVYGKSGYGTFSARGRYSAVNIGIVEVTDAATDYVKLYEEDGTLIATFNDGDSTAVANDFNLWLFY